MKKICLLIPLLMITFFSLSQNINGKWRFQSILPDTVENGENLKDISTIDFMQINKDGSFHYEISKEKLIANGSWQLEGKNLSLHYKLPKDTIRYYQITKNETSLILNENKINFTFKKEAFEPIIIATSGISINSIFRGVLGIISLLLIAFLFSRNRQ